MTELEQATQALLDARNAALLARVEFELAIERVAHTERVLGAAEERHRAAVRAVGAS